MRLHYERNGVEPTSKRSDHLAYNLQGSGIIKMIRNLGPSLGKQLPTLAQKDVYGTTTNTWRKKPAPRFLTMLTCIFRI